MNPTHQAALTVPCPHCKAPAGSPCKKQSLYYHGRPHKIRVTAYNKTNEIAVK